MPESILDIATLSGLISAIGLVIFSLVQIHQTKKALDRFRPWLAEDKKSMEFDKNNLKLNFNYKNYGQLPTSSIKIKAMTEMKQITNDDLKEFPFDSRAKIGIAPPGIVRTYSFDIIFKEGDQSKQSEVSIDRIGRIIKYIQQGKLEFFVGVLLEYKYDGDKTGEYGIIYEYLIERDNFKVDSEWSK